MQEKTAPTDVVMIKESRECSLHSLSSVQYLGELSWFHLDKLTHIHASLIRSDYFLKSFYELNCHLPICRISFKVRDTPSLDHR